MSTKEVLEVSCDECGDPHPAEYSHEGRYGEGSIYAVVCPVDLLTDYYTSVRIKRTQVELLGLEVHRFHDDALCFPGCPAWDSKVKP